MRAFTASTSFSGNRQCPPSVFVAPGKAPPSSQFFTVFGDDTPNIFATSVVLSMAGLASAVGGAGARLRWVSRRCCNMVVMGASGLRKA